MSERGQRVRLRFGAVSAEVSLLATSGKPRAAEHETRRVLVEPVGAGETLVSGAIASVADPVGSAAALEFVGRETEEDIPQGAPMEVNPESGKVRVARDFDGDGLREQTA